MTNDSESVSRVPAFDRRAWRAAALVALAIAGSLAAAAARADYPDRPIHIIVPYAAGGGTDILARRMGPELAKRLGQPVVIENRAGGGTSIGAALAAHAAADGYTLLMTASAHGVLPAMFPNLAFDPVKDFEPVTLFANSPNVLLVNNAVPVKNMKELLDYARSRKEPLDYGSSGYGGTGHLAMEFLKQQTGINFVHVPYASGAPAMTALLGGQVQLLVNNIGPARAQIQANAVRALAVTSKQRAAALPDVPGIAEAANLPDFDMTAWFGILVPAHTPRPIVMKLNAVVNEVVGLAEMRETFAKDGVESVGTTPEAFAELLRSEVARWHRLLKSANIKVD